MPNKTEGPPDPKKEYRRRILDKSIDEVDLSVRTYNVYKAGKLFGVENIGDLVRLSKPELKAKLVWGGLQSEIEDEIEAVEKSLLNDFGLRLGMNEFDIEDFIEFGKSGLFSDHEVQGDYLEDDDDD